MNKYTIAEEWIRGVLPANARAIAIREEVNSPRYTARARFDHPSGHCLIVLGFFDNIDNREIVEGAGRAMSREYEELYAMGPTLGGDQ